MAILVLVVDDNERNAKLARDVLAASGMQTLVAGTAARAIALAQEHRPDVILMDLRLPDLDGTEAVRRLGEDARTADIPVLACSAVPFHEAEQWFRQAGFVDYVQKPLDIRDLPLRVLRSVDTGCPPAEREGGTLDGGQAP